MAVTSLSSHPRYQRHHTSHTPRTAAYSEAVAALTRLSLFVEENEEDGLAFYDYLADCKTLITERFYDEDNEGEEDAKKQ